MPRTNNRRTPRHSNAPRHALLGAGHGVLCVCVYWCVLLRSCRQRWTGRNTCRPAAAAARLLPQEQQAGVQGRQARTFPPCCCCCNKHTMNDCAMRTLYDAHHWCAAARWPAHQAPRHTHTPHMYIIIHYTYCVYTVQSRTPH